jgi:hypothetical protein
MRSGRRWFAGGLVLALAIGVGVVLGAVAGELGYALLWSVREPGSVSFSLSHLRLSIFLVDSDIEQTLVYFEWGGPIPGGIGGIFLGVWLLRRLFGARQSASPNWRES